MISHAEYTFTDQKFLVIKRITAGIIAMMMLVVVLFSVFYISVEAEHDCTGKNCPVCAYIQQCENTLNQIGGRPPAQTAVILPAISFTALNICTSFIFCRETLITGKVRLNN